MEQVGSEARQLQRSVAEVLVAQFDVFKNPRGGGYPLLMDVQADLLSRLGTRIVIPLVPRKRYTEQPFARLNPLVTIRGTEYLLVVQDLASIPASALGERVASLLEQRASVVAAVDLLVTGI